MQSAVFAAALYVASGLNAFVPPASLASLHNGEQDDGESDGEVQQSSRDTEGGAFSGDVFPPDPHLKSFLPNRRMPPLYMHSSGCTGSSIILDIAREIMELHGVVAYIHGGKMYEEVIVPSKNPFFTEKRGINTAMQMLAKAAKKNGTTLMFKSGGLAPELFDKVAPTLQQMGTRVVYMERTNALDYATCMVRDCFEDSVGYPVDKHGKKSTLCFERRFEGETADDNEIKVKYNIDAMLPYLLKLEGRMERGHGAKSLERHNFQNVTTVTMEGLLAYETTKWGSLQQSVTEWSNFLRAWGVEPKHDIIKGYLKPNCGTRDPSPQQDGIYNWGEVKNTLVEAGPVLEKYLQTEDWKLMQQERMEDKLSEALEQ